MGNVEITEAEQKMINQALLKHEIESSIKILTEEKLLTITERDYLGCYQSTLIAIESRIEEVRGENSSQISIKMLALFAGLIALTTLMHWFDQGLKVILSSLLTFGFVCLYILIFIESKKESKMKKLIPKLLELKHLINIYMNR